MLFESDALLMGRETYEVFAAVWPSRSAADDGPGEEGFIDRINSMPKYVASTTLKAPLAWNNSTLVEGDLTQAVAKLKQQSGGNILMYGAGPVAHTLMQHGLIDEVRIWFFPLIRGSGERLFNGATDLPAFKLVDSHPFTSGVVVLTYQPSS
jgi:dihydrofolate reductase